jgi:hypothetical protein
MSQLEVIRDFRSRLGDARDQGSRPTCLAFATSDAHAAARKRKRALSCEYLYFQAQRRGGKTAERGSTIEDTMDSLRNEGQPDERAWPYLDQLPSDAQEWRPPSRIARLFRRVSTSHSAAVGAIIEHLERGRLSVVALAISDSFYTIGGDGLLQATQSEASDFARRHAVLAVGYGLLQGERMILIRNSWGGRWGDAGHGWLPESYLSSRIKHVVVLGDAVP